jgi:CRP-like cAMP-binding protein
LQTVSLFQALPEAALEEIAASSQPRMVEGGSFFFMQGDEARHMYVLTQGRVKLSQVSVDGQQVGMRMVVPPQMFAGIALLNPQKGYPVSAEAMEDASALAWAGDDLRRLADKYPALSFGIMNVMRGFIEEMQSRFRELATERVERRVARALLRLTMQTGSKLESGGIEISLSRQDLAEMSGTTLFSVSRILSEWERHGLLETGRGRVVILKPHGLVSIAEDLSGG